MRRKKIVRLLRLCLPPWTLLRRLSRGVSASINVRFVAEARSRSAQYSFVLGAEFSHQQTPSFLGAGLYHGSPGLRSRSHDSVSFSPGDKKRIAPLKSY